MTVDTVNPALAEWLTRVEAEYREIPGLCLSKPQVQRLWGLDGATCDALLQALEASHVLRRNAQGLYLRADLAH